ncbi:MAG: leucyl aminopeptidase [Cellvibrionales bacterium]|jgi:leucyl aminopeptidase|nr:leucyl aminopeptidase [Cellvibrionales bacterium]
MRATLKSTTDLATFACDTLVIPVYEDLKLNSDSRAIDKASQKQLAKILASDDFNGHSGETVTLRGIAGTAANRIVLWGLGDKDKLSRQALVKACDSLAKAVTGLPGKHCAVLGSLKTIKAVPTSWALQQIAARIARTTYLYTTTKPSKKNPVTLARLSIVNADSTAANRQAITQGVAIGQGINIARELGNLPGNICTPKYLSSQARKLARQHTAIKTTVLGEKQMQALSMDSLLSVGHGSVEESQLMVINYQGGKKSQKPHVLVGKGITFDSGGISLKPGARMDEMKFDMCGAASVIGTLSAIAEMKLPLNVIGVIPAAENMPSSRATKPGDVVTSMSGKTIEVLNTDAEGRLVLCDALTYVERFKPESVVDIATLTGACIMALGHHASGLLSNDDDLANSLLAAGTDSADRAWQLPLWDVYKKQLSSPFADLGNIAAGGAGTITAACFLSEFTEKYRWAHLDIAGTAWGQAGGKGASGRPVGLLCQYLISLAGKAAV